MIVKLKVAFITGVDWKENKIGMFKVESISGLVYKCKVNIKYVIQGGHNMKLKTVSLILSIASLNSKVMASTAQINQKRCFSVTPMGSDVRHTIQPRFICYDSSVARENVLKLIDKYLSENNLEKQNVLLAEWTEIQD